MVRKILFDRSSTADYLGSIQVLDAHGNVFLDSLNSVPDRQNYQATTFFQHHKDVPDNQLFIGHPFRPKPNAPYAVPISRRLEMADGSFAGVVVGSMDIAYFRDTFSKVLPGQDSGISLIMTDGTVVTRFPYNEGTGVSRSRA